MKIHGTALSLLGLFVCSCIVQTEPGISGDPGPPGDAGSPGAPGEAGVPDNAALSALQTAITSLQTELAAVQSKCDTLQSKADALQSKVEALELQIADPDCPVGYAKDANPATPFHASVLCTKGADEIVKVGTAASAFWIDRYEASVWTTPDGPATGAQEFADGDDSSANFPKNGQLLDQRYALSVAGVTPARFITWFQAAEACESSGKRLPTGREWLRAARGTRDAGANEGNNNKKCNTKSNFPTRATGHALGPAVDESCVSDWGAQDMIGNLFEWTDEWHAGLGDALTSNGTWSDTTFGDYHADITWGISSSAEKDNISTWVQGLPSATVRGGHLDGGAGSGLFALGLTSAPSAWTSYYGFRCARTR